MSFHSCSYSSSPSGNFHCAIPYHVPTFTISNYGSLRRKHEKTYERQQSHFHYISVTPRNCWVQDEFGFTNLFWKDSRSQFTRRDRKRTGQGSSLFFPQGFTAKTLGYYKWPKEARSRWFAYYPQSNGFAKVWNCEVKKVLEKTTNTSWKDWSTNLMMHFRPTALPTR